MRKRVLTRTKVTARKRKPAESEKVNDSLDLDPEEVKVDPSHVVASKNY